MAKPKTTRNCGMFGLPKQRKYPMEDRAHQITTLAGCSHSSLQSAWGGGRCVISLDQFSDSFPALATKGLAPQSAIADRVDLAAARRSLTPRENFVVAMLFDRDRPAREVAEKLHVNESRVSQIKQRALGKLPAHLTATPPARAA